MSRKNRLRRQDRLRKQMRQVVNLKHPVLSMSYGDRRQLKNRLRDEYYALTGTLDGVENYIMDSFDQTLKRQILDILHSPNGGNTQINVLVPDNINSNIVEWVKEIGGTVK